MKPKNLLPLFIVLGILVALTVVRKSGEKEVTIEEVASLVSLVPDGLKGSDLARIEMYTGAKVDEKLVLARVEADKWVAQSQFNAPVKSDKVEEYLKDLLSLQGEFRASADEAGLADYDLADDEAFHVLGYKEGDAEAFHVLVGKDADYRTVFMRQSGSNEVYVEDSNLRSKAGASGDTAPTASSWLDKSVIDLEKEDVEKITVTTPGKTLSLEKKVTIAEVEEEKKEGDEEAENSSQDAGVPPQPPVVEWVVQGAYGRPHKQTGIDAVLRQLDTTSATDIVDPANLAEYGLDAPDFRLEVALATQDDPVVVEGGRPKADGDGYVRKAGTDTIYKVSKYVFEQLFPKGEMLFELPGLALNAADATRVSITQPEGDIVLVKAGDEWTVESPSATLEVQKATLDAIVTGVAGWKPVDYADGDKAGAFTATRTLEITAGGATHRIALGADATDVDGVLAQLDGGSEIWTMSRPDVTKIFKKPGDLYAHRPFDLEADDITEMFVKPGEDSVRLTRAGDAWQAQHETAIGPVISGETNQARANSLAKAIADLEADDLYFGTFDALQPDGNALSVTTDAVTHTLRFYGTHQGRRLAQMEATGQGLLFEQGTAAALLPKAGELITVPVETPAADETPAAEETLSEEATPTADEPAGITLPVESAPATN